MWIKGLQINNFRCFDNINPLLFSREVNIIVGPNNSGKSSILKAIKHIQVSHRNDIVFNDIRRKTSKLNVTLYVDDINTPQSDFSTGGPIPEHKNFITDNNIKYSLSYHVNVVDGNKSNFELFMHKYDNGYGSFKKIQRYPGSEPTNILYPFSSKRNVSTYSPDVKSETAKFVRDDFENIVARFLNTMGYRNKRDEFDKIIHDILGMYLNNYSADNGPSIGYTIENELPIGIDAMGDGVPHVISFLMNLLMAKDKIFLIEEIESFLHPMAIKKMASLILEKSKDNQFFITTHSNIVTKYLGADENAKIFRVDNAIKDNVPTSTVKEVVDENSKIELLENLGYELNDFNIWNSWLIFEESSAETIITKYLIPWYVRGLYNKTGHISAKGIDTLKAKVEDFNRLFLYIHQQPIYKNKAWVLFDGGEYGNKIRAEFVNSAYCKKGNWSEDNFICFKEDNFEKYYPAFWSDKVKAALDLKGEEKKNAKEALLSEVISWIEENLDLAKLEFSKSAKEVIDILKVIENKVNGKN